MIDHASILSNLARAQLQSIDRSRIDTPVQTETLIMLLEGLIDLAESPAQRAVATAATKYMDDYMAGVARAREMQSEEDHRQLARREAQQHRAAAEAAR